MLHGSRISLGFRMHWQLTTFGHTRHAARAHRTRHCFAQNFAQARRDDDPAAALCVLGDNPTGRATDVPHQKQ